MGKKINFIVLLLIVICLTTCKKNENGSNPATISNFSDLKIEIAKIYKEGGGTIYIPEGTFVWGQGEDNLAIPGGINLIGAGKDKTFIVANGKKACMFLINKFGSDCRPVRISGISFRGWSLDANFEASKYAIGLSNIQDFRIDNCTFEGFTYVMTIGSRPGFPHSRGVIDHCFFNNRDLKVRAAYGISVSDTWEGNERLTNLGTKEAIFIEDNLFIDYGHPTASFGGGHYVARYNTFRNENVAASFPLDGHGPGFEDSGRGTRCLEIYNNLMEDKVATTGQLNWRAIGPRAGGGVIFKNTIRNFRHAVIFTLDTETTTYPAHDQIHDYYIWDNILENVTEEPVWIYGSNPTNLIKQDRDYFLRAPSKEIDGFTYTPYVYPHPLISDPVLGDH